MERLEMVSSTTDAAFAADRAGHILAWNRAAERVLGLRRAEVLGRPCWQVLAGRDVYGNEYCGPDCPLLRMSLRHRAVHPCHLVFRNGLGEPARTRVVTMAVPGETPAEVLLVHVLSPVACKECDPAPPPGPTQGKSIHRRLTRREQEILGCLAEGLGTREICEHLGLSAATVRNHLDHLFKKLGVHSRVEALARARRTGLID